MEHKNVLKLDTREPWMRCRDDLSVPVRQNKGHAVDSGNVCRNFISKKDEIYINCTWAARVLYEAICFYTLKQ